MDEFVLAPLDDPFPVQIAAVAPRHLTGFVDREQMEPAIVEQRVNATRIEQQQAVEEDAGRDPGKQQELKEVAGRYQQQHRGKRHAYGRKRWDALTHYQGEGTSAALRIRVASK